MICLHCGNKQSEITKPVQHTDIFSPDINRIDIFLWVEMDKRVLFISPGGLGFRQPILVVFRAPLMFFFVLVEGQGLFLPIMETYILPLAIPLWLVTPQFPNYTRRTKGASASLHIWGQMLFDHNRQELLLEICLRYRSCL